MGKHTPISRQTLAKAYALGKKMAVKDRRFQPVIKESAMSAGYESFRKAQRVAFESRPDFEAWDDLLNDEARREGKRMGFRLESSSWAKVDAFLTHVLGPIKNAFWLGWEDAWKVELRFSQAEKRYKEMQVHASSIAVFRARAATMRAGIEDIRNVEADEDEFLLNVAGDPAAAVAAPKPKPEPEPVAEDELADELAPEPSYPIGKDRPAVFPASMLLKRKMHPKTVQGGDDDFLLRATGAEPEVSTADVAPAEPKKEKAPSALHDAAVAAAGEEIDFFESDDVDVSDILGDATKKK